LRRNYIYSRNFAKKTSILTRIRANFSRHPEFALKKAADSGNIDIDRNSDKATSFAVCAMVHEDMETLDRFIRHYLSIGAAEIRLYCDGGLPRNVPADLCEKVTLVDCGPAFWQALPERIRPPRLETRKKAATGMRRHAAGRIGSCIPMRMSFW
jgi:hypothetical protein